MKRFIGRVSLIVALAGAVAACVPPPGASGDSVKPEVVSVSVSPDEVSPGQQFTVSAVVTDAGGVRGVAFTVRRNGAPAGFCSGNAVRVSGTPGAGTWERTCTAPLVVNSGEYQVNTLAADMANNLTVIADSPPNDTSGHFTVLGDVSDAFPPNVESVTVAPAALAPGEVFVITARVTDDTGVAGVGFTVRTGGTTPGWCAANAVLTDGTPQDGTWQRQCTVPINAPAGEYAVTTLVADVLGNIEFLGDAPPGPTTGSFTVG